MTASEARIKEALNRRLAGQTRAISRLASALAAKAVADAVAGVDPAVAVDSALATTTFEEGVKTLVANAVFNAACAGVGIMPSLGTSAPVDVGIKNAQRTAFTGFWDDSGMTLSDSLHVAAQEIRDEVVGAVRGHVAARDTFWNAARKIYDGYGYGGIIHQQEEAQLPADLEDLVKKARFATTPQDFREIKKTAEQLAATYQEMSSQALRSSYLQLLKRCEHGAGKGLETMAKTAVEEKARYHANRILRTEAARSFGQAFLLECQNMSMVAAVRWQLSSGHSVCDICDFYAHANLYGMGAGVYPLDKVPNYPAHPHCHCPLGRGIRGDVGEEKKGKVRAGGAAALRKMTASQRVHLMGIKGANYFAATGKWESHLRGYGDVMRVSSGAVETVKAVREALPALSKEAGRQKLLDAAKERHYGRTAEQKIKIREAWKASRRRVWYPNLQAAMKTYKPAKTIAEASAFAARYLADAASYKGLTLKAANIMNEVAGDILLKFPKAREKLDFLGESHAHRRYWQSKYEDEKKLRGCVPTFVIKRRQLGTFFPGGRVKGIVLNNRTFAKDDVGMRHDFGVGRFHPPLPEVNDENIIRQVVSHEFGHAIDFAYGVHDNPEFKELFEVTKAKGLHHEVSIYAWTDSYKNRRSIESIAEGWSEYYLNGDNARPFALNLARIMEGMR